MVHRLKLNESFADAVRSGEKCFEVRENDRGFQKGDTVFFTVIDRIKVPMNDPLNNVAFEVTYVLSGWGIKENYCVFGIKRKGEKI